MKTKTIVTEVVEDQQTQRKTTRPDALARAAEAVRLDAQVNPAEYVSDAIVPKGGE